MSLSGETPLFPFINAYARLPEHFFARLAPTPVVNPRLIKVNDALARFLGIDPAQLATPEGVAVLAGNNVPEGAEPLSIAYVGHQFGGFVPQLGDGRAILLGEVIGRDGHPYDVQLKGSGPTPFSRRGDGRAALGPVLREYIVSEAMAALGVPTTRSLAAVTTGEWVYREGALPGAVLTRVASSHVRVGTFQFFAARRDTDGVRTLADYVIARHYPAAREAPNPYRALLDGVVARQATLIAHWMMIGFIHGVMNTDNTSISGETIDYGPCAFMDTYHPETVYSSIDARGRYAFVNQPAIAHWNLTRLAECLLPLLGASDEARLAQANEALAAFAGAFETASAAGLRRKVGLNTAQDGDAGLVYDLLERMDANNADFTLTFRALCDTASDPTKDADVAKLFDTPAAFAEWAVLWRERLAAENGDAIARRDAMRAANPAVIPRNHLIEEAIAAAVASNDFTLFEKLNAVLERPFEDQAAPYTSPPLPHQVVAATFCGT